jgi:hypothetical protein
MAGNSRLRITDFWHQFASCQLAYTPDKSFRTRLAYLACYCLGARLIQTRERCEILLGKRRYRFEDEADEFDRWIRADERHAAPAGIHIDPYCKAKEGVTIPAVLFGRFISSLE